MFASHLSVFAFGLGLMTLPVASMAQSNPKAGQTPTPAPATNSAPAGTTTDSSWSSASEAQPSAPTGETAAATAVAPATSVAAAAVAPAPVSSAAATPAISLNNAPPTQVATQSDEPPTLFNRKSVKVGGYGAVAIQYARINGTNGVLTGAEGALLLDHRLAIGIAGYGWGNQDRLPASQLPDRPYMHFGYGGLLMRYHFYIPDCPVYFSAAALVGGGVVGLTEFWDSQLYRENTDGFFIFEPQIGVHVNFTRWMRMGLDAGYRLTSGVGKFGFTESNFNGLSLGGNIGFGWF